MMPRIWKCIYLHEWLFSGPFSSGKDALSHISNSDVKTSLFESIAYKEADKNYNRNPFLVVLNQRHFAFSRLLSTDDVKGYPLDDVAIDNGVDINKVFRIKELCSRILSYLWQKKVSFSSITFSGLGSRSIDSRNILPAINIHHCYLIWKYCKYWLSRHFFTRIAIVVSR
jgi:hypothetical protein